ncbi:MAG: TIGR04222 domain-containing membrane protein [Coleofasciculus sp. B1-GNL1-01]|uniref:TIGR04222 domain-containing membrane protein n=1 Tax=Coleofasciculus sp. B1-GNL1-01 TaxID=3068484 RepID=UPI0032F86AA9
MDSPQTELYKRIQAFSLDQLDDQLSFSKRLAKDNRWSLDYTQRVIEEYKKFTFLAVAAGHPVAPSEQVDQVWHLHLSYTRSYWQEFCPKILQTPLHHEPSRGGSSEQLKFEDLYSRTLESYKHFFGQIPPIDIWSDPKDRFGRDLQVVRVNTQHNWIVPKLSLNWLPKRQHQHTAILFLLFILASVVTGCQIVYTIPNPLNFTGSEFLIFYFLLSIGVVFIAFRLQVYLRLPGGNLVEKPVSLNPYEVAYLAEGKNRVVDTAIASLVQKEYVTVQPEQRTLTLVGTVEVLSHPVEQAVANAITSDGCHIDRVRIQATQTIDVIIEEIKNRLHQLELLISQEQLFKVQVYPTLLIVALLGLGMAKIGVGIYRGKSVGFLVIMCLIISLMISCLAETPKHRSRYGDQVLHDLRSRIPLNVLSPEDSQLALAFAIWGNKVLRHDLLADLKMVFTSVSRSKVSSNRGSGVGCGGGGGGGCGGGGGGGCGGCGGGGC